MHKTKAARMVGMKCWSLQDRNKTVPTQSERVEAMPMPHSAEAQLTNQLSNNKAMAVQIVSTE
jgi:hypothetical protein